MREIGTNIVEQNAKIEIHALYLVSPTSIRHSKMLNIFRPIFLNDLFFKIWPKIYFVFKCLILVRETQ